MKTSHKLTSHTVHYSHTDARDTSPPLTHWTLVTRWHTRHFSHTDTQDTTDTLETKDTLTHRTLLTH
jgi:hypothetical protein